MSRCARIKQGTKIAQGALIDSFTYRSRDDFINKDDFQERDFVGFENSQNYSNFSNIP